MKGRKGRVPLGAPASRHRAHRRGGELPGRRLRPPDLRIAAPPWPFDDSHASNGVSRALGYQPNGVDWATRRGDAAEIHRWRLTREQWSTRRRDDIELVGVAECLPVMRWSVVAVFIRADRWNADRNRASTNLDTQFLAGWARAAIKLKADLLVEADLELRPLRDLSKGGPLRMS
jgi:hypothetical protein